MNHIHIPKYVGNISDKLAKYWLTKRCYKYSPDIPIYQYISLLTKDHDAYQSITDIQPIMVRAHNQDYK